MLGTLGTLPTKRDPLASPRSSLCTQQHGRRLGGEEQYTPCQAEAVELELYHLHGDGIGLGLDQATLDE